MSQLLLGVEFFRLRKGGVECDERGLRVAGDDLLEKSQIENGARWQVTDLSAVESALARAYGCEIEAKGKLGALTAIAAALEEENTALAQIGALLLKLPDPPPLKRSGDDGRVLRKALQDNGWPLKYWDPDEHPRAGVAPNPGWFAPKDQAGESPSKPRDIRVAQAEGAASFLPHPDPADVRKAIAAAAKNHVNSKMWANDTFYGPLLGDNVNKCFLFVRDMAREAGADPGTPNSHYMLSLPPFAGQWAAPNYDIPGWSVLGPDETPEPGDVVAQRLGYSDASGHVMIVGDDNTFIGTGDPPGKDPGTIEQIPYRDFLGPPLYRNDPTFSRGPLVYRRWVGP